MTEQTITIALNGVSATTPAATVSELLAERGIDADLPGVAVAINDRVVRRSDWSTTSLGANDRVEIITAMAGG